MKLTFLCNFVETHRALRAQWSINSARSHCDSPNRESAGSEAQNNVSKQHVWDSFFTAALMVRS
jgi:hypothetical protein